jgi:hypothetical protein
MSIMKKVWVYKRTGIKGWWVGWYESGKRKAKALPTRKLAEHYCQLKYSQLNSDVFTGIVTIGWKQMVVEHMESKKVQGVTEATLYETALTLRHFERLIGKCNSKQIAQNSIDKFILQRGTEIKRSTLNKDIRNLRTFINWCRKKQYVNGEVEIRELKEDERPVKSLNVAQVKKLMSVAEPYQTVRMRILLALGTGGGKAIFFQDLGKGDVRAVEPVIVVVMDAVMGGNRTGHHRAVRRQGQRDGRNHIFK